MSKKTKWEERIDDLLAEFGLTRAELLKGHIKIDDKVGTIKLSDEVKPIMITVKNVDDAKRFAGVPDEDYNDALSKHFDTLPPCPKKYNQLAPDDLEPKHKQDINRAMISYVFGNSEKVKSYKDIINKYHFPMETALITGDTLTVYTGQVYTLDGNTIFDTITVYKDGTLNCTNNITVNVKNLVQLPDTKLPPGVDQSFPLDAPPGPTFCSIGADGVPGTDGNNGHKGATGSTGSSATSDKHCEKGGKGGTGGIGSEGNDGVDGGNGQNGSSVCITIEEISGDIVLLSSGGNGGKGGNGGNGGDGGEGGPGGPKSDTCDMGPQGIGGAGGTGGKGGNGGNGGNGDAVIFKYTSKAPAGASIKLGNPKGTGGAGGTGGSGGTGGTGNPVGGNGSKKEKGSNGTDGKVGPVSVNGKII